MEFDGADLARLGRQQMRALRRDVQVVFQDPYGSLNPRRRVGSIIADPLVDPRHAEGDGARPASQELMELVGLNPEHHNRFPAAFSGGQRQRIGVARALALEPRLVICDEPVSALDVSVQAQIINLLQRLQRELDLTYLFVSHDLGVIEHIADRVAVMYLGRIVETAPTDELFAAPPPSLHAGAARRRTRGRPGDRRRVELVAGDVPSPIAPPTGCRFHTRCRYAEDDCSVEDPALVARAGDADGPSHGVPAPARRGRGGAPVIPLEAPLVDASSPGRLRPTASSPGRRRSWRSPGCAATGARSASAIVIAADGPARPRRAADRPVDRAPGQRAVPRHRAHRVRAARRSARRVLAGHRPARP